MVTKKASTSKRRLPSFGFIGDIIGELRKVTWPTRQEAIRLTIMVLIVCAVIGVILALLDWGFGRLIRDVLLKL
ncbi:MAG TPA: preprotein translocase subunit SecE [Dehalococcoidia bacterium]|nr:preprotein translocase subunit SecE [Dehalococcoidia bacterium]